MTTFRIPKDRLRGAGMTCAWLDDDSQRLCIIAGDGEYSEKLTVDEVRALRDWLNEVLPDGA